MQVSVLDEASRTHPNVWWWIKADGCDLVEGLGESTKLDWSGDVDKNDGKLQEMFKSYRARLDFISGLGKKNRRELAVIVQDLSQCTRDVKEDISFVSTGELNCIHVQILVVNLPNHAFSIAGEQ